MRLKNALVTILDKTLHLWIFLEKLQIRLALEREDAIPSTDDCIDGLRRVGLTELLKHIEQIGAINNYIHTNGIVNLLPTENKIFHGTKIR